MTAALKLIDDFALTKKVTLTVANMAFGVRELI